VHSTLLCKRMHKGLYNWELVRTQFKTLKLNCRANTPFKARRFSEARLLFIIKRACTVAPKLRRPGLAQIKAAAQSRRHYWPVSQGSALTRQASLGPSRAAPVFSLWRCRVERAVRSHSLRAWAIGRAQMAIPSKECTLLHTIYNRLW